MSKAVKNYALSLTLEEIQLIDNFFHDNPEYKKSSVLKMLFLNWINERKSEV